MRNYATIDQAKFPPDSVVERGATVMRTSAASAPQTGRSTIAKSVGAWYVECVIFGTLGAGSDIRVGACVDAQSSGVALGGNHAGSFAQNYGVGYCADGYLRWYNSGGAALSINTGMPYDPGDVIGVLIDNDGRTISWSRNGTPVPNSVTMPWAAGTPCTPAWTLVAGAPDETTTPDIAILYNAGQQRMEGVAAGIVGWWEPVPGIGLVRVADRPYRDIATPSEAWPAGLSAAALQVTQAVSFWPWGGRAARASATLRLDNDGRFDRLLAEDARDATVRVRRLVETEFAASEELVATLTVDSVQAADDSSVTLTLRDNAAALAVPMQDRLFLPTADEPVVGKPWPVVIGAGRSVPLTCMDVEEQIYAISDGAIAGLASLRDRGAQLAPSLGDYVLQQDGPGTVTLTGVAQGKVTADMSSLGGDVPGGPVDLLGGKGDFHDSSDWTLPSGWQIRAAGSGLPRRLYGVSDGSSGQIVRGVKLPFAPVAGHTYMIRVTMLSLFDGRVATTTNGAPTANVSIRYGTSSAPSPFASESFSPVLVYTPYVRNPHGGSPIHNEMFDVGSQPTSFIATANSARPLWLTFDAGTGYACNFNVAEIVVWELAQNEVDDESLVPATFAQACSEIFRRAGWTAAQWSMTDALAIDAATGYAGVGIVSTTEAPLTVEAGLRLLCDSYCVDWYIDETGMLRFVRLIDPATVAPTATITARDMREPPRVSIDLAPELTTQLGGRKNWMPLAASEMVSDDVGLPLALDGGAAA